MTDSDTRTETWKPVPGFSRYEASDLGRIRNSAGLILKTRLSNSGYPQLNVTDDQGRVQTRTVHSLVLLTFAGPCPPGMEGSHANDVPTDNRWPENLAWETKPRNEQRKFENGRPKPVPPRRPKTCIICQREFAGAGRRCHPCVVKIGKQAAEMLRAGVPLEKAAAQLEYPSPEGLHKLAVKYGRYGWPLSRRVSVTLRDMLRGGRGDRG